ncbi:PREDICTED: glutamate receptor 3.6-like [Ipomoea nil]|uniref:glutamate receptor 3.6-like n=1 Tax=Ipomoea nil TaxID=35883 RepID=UPI000900E90E|nr:PREDICTED: glutamate receptor 3.6-like [Ipomoea nil]
MPHAMQAPFLFYFSRVESGVLITQFIMKLFWALMFAVFYFGYLSQGQGVNSTLSARPKVVNIGCILTLRSDVGKITKLVIETAVEDINSNPAVLGGTKLIVTILDNNSSGLMGIVEAIRFLETDTVAIIGPQSSVIAHVISHIANKIHVPLLSFSATDPALTSLQYPFFVRTSPNDMFQMDAIASIVEFYQWKAVVAIYVDDEYGRSGIAALADKLAMRQCRITFKAPLKPHATLDEVRDMLVQVALTESRIIVVHTYPYRGLDIFSLAKSLGMTERGYAWIATHWLSTIFDTKGPLSQDVMDTIQGTLTLRAYVPDSEAKRNFVSRWSNLAKRIDSNITLGMCTYGLYAYDTVWLLARALDAFFKQGGNVSFSRNPMLETGLNLYSMDVFDGGKLLLDNILKTNISGVTGLFKYTSDQELYRPAFEVINVIGTGVRKVGYWSNYSGLSVVHPDSLDSYPSSRFSSSQQLYTVVWTGETTQKPRGWVFPNYGRTLKVGVPIRAGLHEFVERVPGTDMFKGYCIEVFTTALNYLPYAVPCKFFPFGESNYTELVGLVTEGVYDAAAGTIAITSNRTEMVDFTQPYIQSGYVVVVPVRERGSSAWAFLRPFTPTMWCVTGMFFLLIGATIWILEHRTNDHFRGAPRDQIETIFWFGFLTFVSGNKEGNVKVVSTLGRLVLMIWLFVVLIINSSYTANLASILMVQHLSSPIKGIESLLTTNDPIGYHRGSFIRSYLIEELGIHESRLIPFNVTEDYAKALRDGPKKGGVAAVIDQRVYMELFLSTHCEFCIVGSEFFRNGMGFAFPKDSQLAVDMSTAIQELSDNGELQRIHDKWLLKGACKSQDTELEVNRLHLKCFSGLFLMCGFACIFALLLHFSLPIYQFISYYSHPADQPSSSESSPRPRALLPCLHENESSVKYRSKRQQLHRVSS